MHPNQSFNLYHPLSVIWVALWSHFKIAKQIFFQTELNQKMQACHTSNATSYLTFRVYLKKLN